MTTLQTTLPVSATVTASQSLTAGHHTPVDVTGGAVTLTLPTPATVGARLRVEKIDTSANTVTISGTIRGTATTVTLTSQYHTIELVAESLTSWRPVSDHRTTASQDARYDAAGAAAAAQAFAVQRANHTGTQAASTVTGLATVATSGQFTDLASRPAIDVDYWSGRQHVGLATGSMFYGSMTSAQIAADITLIRAVGGDTVRTDLDWSAIETSHGVYDWTKPDTVFDSAAAQGVALIFTVVGSPAWARTAGEASKIYAPTNVADYANFCAAASARYKNRGGKGCHLWEIWNEPNAIATFGTPLDYAKYVALIGAAYTALKATDPDCTVIVGGILRGGRENWAAGTNLDTNWLNGAYAAGLAGKFDVLGFHPYSEPWDPAATTPTGDPTGSNLVSNGTFETNITGWAADNGTLAQSSTQVHSGTKALRLTASGAGVARAYFNNAPVVAGTYYLASAWIYAHTGDQIQASVNWSDSSFAYLSTDDGDALTVPATGWYFVTMRKDAAPVGAAYATLKLQTINTPTAGTLYYYDDVALNVASSAEHGWNRIPDVRAVMVTNGDAGKPIWITEVGQHTGTAASFVDEPTQALYLAHALQRLKSYPYVQRMMWYSHRDSGTDLTNNQNNYGITHNDGSPKAAYAVMLAAQPTGLPAGGTSGQVLAKNSSTDYDTGWTTPATGGSTGTTVQFTTAGAWATWTKPAGVNLVHIFAVSGGGGGGGGASGAAGTARGGGAGGAGGNLMRVSFAASVVPATLYVNPGAGGTGGAAGATGGAGARSYVSIAQNTTASNLFAISGATDTAGGAGGTSSGSAAGGTASGVPSTSLATFLSLGAFVGTGGNGGASGGNATGTAGGATTPLNGVATAPGSGGGGTGTGNVDTAGGAVNAVGPLSGVAGGTAGGGAGNPGASSSAPFCTSGGTGGGSSGASGTGGVGGAGAAGSGGAGGGAGVTGGAGGKGGDGIVIIVATV